MLTGVTLEELCEIREEEAEERGAARAAKEKEAAIQKAIEEKNRIYVTKLLKKNWAVEEIQELTDVPLDKILEIQAAIH
ncbi:MAG: hypothetical protein HFE75_00330 [Firmicutes bacterium]|nr:hypothetical protein [Bacillota bacterium]